MYLHLPIFFILIISACTFVGIAPILVAVATVVLIILHSIQLRNLKAFFRKPGSHRSSEYQGRPPHIFWRIVSDLFQSSISIYIFFYTIMKNLKSMSHRKKEQVHVHENTNFRAFGSLF